MTPTVIADLESDIAAFEHLLKSAKSAMDKSKLHKQLADKYGALHIAQAAHKPKMDIKGAVIEPTLRINGRVVERIGNLATLNVIFDRTVQGSSKYHKLLPGDLMELTDNKGAVVRTFKKRHYYE